MDGRKPAKRRKHRADGVSGKTLRMMDSAVDHLRQGKVSAPVAIEKTTDSVSRHQAWQKGLKQEEFLARVMR